MVQTIFVNLAVKDLAVSMKFFRALGFEFNATFTDANAACLVLSDQIFAMLITHGRFRDFTPRAISDPLLTTEVLTCLGVDSKVEADRIADAALANGGSPCRPPEDLGFMYGRSFCDPDGHIWELAWIDQSQIPSTGANA